MKKVLLSAVAVLAVLGAAAQDLPPMKADTTETHNIVVFGPVGENPNQMSVRVGGYELLLERDHHGEAKNKYSRPYGGRIGTFEIGFNGFRAGGDAYAMYPDDEKGFMDLNMGKSFHFTINLFTFSTSFTRNNVVGLSMAIGLTSNDYVFETPARYEKVDKMIRPVAPDTELKKAKLHTTTLHIPLALEINPTRNFFFSLGGYADLMLGSHMKSKFPKEKLKSPYTNFLQAGVTASLGFRNIYVFGSYGLVEMFQGGKGPALNPYTFGFGFGF